MDLTEAADRLRIAHERYEAWREARAALRALAPGDPVSGAIREACALLAPDLAGPMDRTRLTAALEELQILVKRQRTEARRDYWHQQGKALRYSLVVIEHRLEQAGAEMAVHGVTPETATLLEALERESSMVREALGEWDAGPRPGQRLCTLREVERMILQPYHDADKEQLERVVERACAAHLPADLRCIRLVWDSVSGEVLEAQILPDEKRHAA